MAEIGAPPALFAIPQDSSEADDLPIARYEVFADIGDLPSYSRAPPPAAPPPPNPYISIDTLLPAKFLVGGHRVSPFVTVPGCIQHLKLLACFARLKKDVLAWPAPEGDATTDPVARWSLFCALAAHRFEKWASTTLTARTIPDTDQSAITASSNRKGKGRAMPNPLKEEELPGIEVLLVWHAYMLSPKWYAADCARGLAGLESIGGFPLEMIVRNIHPTSMVYIPSAAITSDPFYYSSTLLSAIYNPNSTRIHCPRCDQIFLVTFPPSIGQTYLKDDWFTSCSNCDLRLTHLVYKVAKFARDMVALSEGSLDHLAGTEPDPDSGFINNQGSMALNIALRDGFKLKISVMGTGTQRLRAALSPKAPPRATTVREIGELLTWSYYVLRNLIEAIGLDGWLQRSIRSLGNSKEAYVRTLDRLWAAYGHEGIASLDLGAAVQRQGVFVAKMSDVKWLDVGRFEGEGAARIGALQKAAARYHAFLDIMAANPSKFISPTLDIDLAWHTHQLAGNQYAQDTIDHVGKFIDHDDTVGTATLGDALAEISSLWSDRFELSYTACLCPSKPELQGTGRDVKVPVRNKENVRPGSDAGKNRRPSFLARLSRRSSSRTPIVGEGRAPHDPGDLAEGERDSIRFVMDGPWGIAYPWCETGTCSERAPHVFPGRAGPTGQTGGSIPPTQVGPSGSATSHSADGDPATTDRLPPLSRQTVIPLMPMGYTSLNSTRTE